MDIEEYKILLRDDIKNKYCDLYETSSDYTVKLLKYSENIIYKISFSNGDSPVVFRIHRPGYHDIDELESEMIWMDEIAQDTDICLPIVYKGKNKKIIQQLETSNGEIYNCSVISFLEGDILGDLKNDALVDAIRQMGFITAKLHLQAINRKDTPLKRFKWDNENILGDGIWGNWRDYPELDSNMYNLLECCEKKIEKKLDAYGRTRDHYGLIHSDLHFYNVIQHNGINQIFDFDDCGYGFYMYDLGCTLVTYSKDIELLKNEWVKGYESIRKLTNEDKGMLDTFILLRRIVRLAWFASHWDSDTRKNMDCNYVNVTMEMAQYWNNNN